MSTEIDALRAENARLTGERDRQYEYNAEQIVKQAELEAENARLREALEWYAAEGDEKFQIVDSKGETIASFASFASRARAALKDMPQK